MKENNTNESELSRLQAEAELILGIQAAEAETDQETFEKAGNGLPTTVTNID